MVFISQACLCAVVEGKDVKETTAVHPGAGHFSCRSQGAGEGRSPISFPGRQSGDRGLSLDRVEHIKLPSICRSKERFQKVTKANKNSKQYEDNGKKSCRTRERK